MFDCKPLLNALFPKTLYNEAKSGNREAKDQIRGLTLHFLIAQNQSLKNIGAILKMDPQAKNRRSEKFYQLSPAHIATIAGRLDVLNLLRENGAQFTEPDHLGWTPLHHAAARNDRIALEQLIQWVGGESAALRLKSLHEGTYRDLQEILSRDLPPPTEVVCKYREEDGSVRDCTAEEYKRLTGKEYTTGILASANNLYDFWRSRDPRNYYPVDKEPVKIMTDAYGFGKLPESSYGFNLIALADISAGTFLSEPFLGRLKSPGNMYAYGCETLSKGLYSTTFIDANLEQNVLSLANQSFPNMIAIDSLNNGMPTFYFQLIADVKAGQPLFWHYSLTYELEFNHPMVELNKPDLFRFVHTLDENWPNASTNLDSHNLYFLSTFAAFIALYIESSLPFSETIKSMTLKSKDTRLSNTQKSFLEALQRVDNQLSETKRDKFKQALREWNETLSCVHVINGIHFLDHILGSREPDAHALKDTKLFLKILSHINLELDAINRFDDLTVFDADYSQLSPSSKGPCLSLLKSFALKDRDYIDRIIDRLSTM